MINDPVAFVFSLLNEEGTFRFSPASDCSNIYSTCFGILALDLLGELNSIPSETRKKSVDFIQSKQDKDSGLFRDPDTEINRQGKHDEEYIVYQITDFCIMALDALGAKPQYPLSFLTRFRDKAYLKNYLLNLNWKDPWLASNSIMFILNFLILQEDSENTEFIMNWLEKNQDPVNGYWNLGESVDWHNQMAGAFHFVIFFTYLDKNIPNIDNMIDPILIMQEYDGLFNYAGGGGSCDDLDAIDILCRSRLYTAYKHKKVVSAIEKAFKALLHNQNPDGGFCWAKRDTVSIAKAFRVFKPGLIKLSYKDFRKNLILKLANQYQVLFKRNKLTWRYSGLKNMEIPLSASDLWSTWFRLLALATIETQFPELKRSGINWNMKQSPGLGFYKKFKS